jgi:PAS domain S-box-containing protein
MTKTTIDYRSLFHSLPERYVVFEPKSPDFIMIAASDAYFEVTGKSADQVLGNGLFDVFPDTSELARTTGKGELQRSLEKVLTHKTPDSTGIIRYDLTDEQGILQVRYWQATHYPLFENDVLVGILQSTADVTELVTSNEQLKLANMKLEEALSAGLVGSWSWDVQNDVVTADKGLAVLFGVSSEEALHGLPLDSFINSIFEDDRDRVTHAIQQVLKSGDVFESEYRTIDTEGVIRWVIARGRVERDTRGKPVHFPGVMIDISSRKKIEDELKESETRLRFMADTMPHLVWITRPDGYHEYYNKHWYEYTGTKVGSTDGEGWNNLFHPDDQPRAWKVWKQSLASGEPYEIKYRLYHAPTDSYRWVIGRALPFKNSKGAIVKWYGTCTDIHDTIELETALKEERDRLEQRVAERTSQLKLTNEGLRDEIKKRQRVEKKLREYSNELQRSNKELEEFAYVSSHDLQEPLRKIQAFSDLLVDEYSGQLGGGDEYLSRIKSSASRMSVLIEDLLAFSRVSTKQIVSKQVDLNEIVTIAISDLDERISREHGEVVIATKLPVVRADETHMRQLFQNLLSNALKFHADDRAPVVTVSYEKDNDSHRISVKDNGIGIDKKYKEKIFAVFQRLHAKQAFDGTGIGLAVCKKIVERYGGTIEVESQLGVGTTFIIILPIENEV